MTASTPARPAATLVVFRDRPGQDAELLIMERSKAMVFAAGAVVFPGGRVDEADATLARAIAPDMDVEEAAARIGAIRETLEESGLAIGFAQLPDPDVLATVRHAMTRGHEFGALLARHDMSLDLAQLVPFARWRPDTLRESRVYDTRFYLARLPADSHAATIDATENVHLFWASAREVLDRADRGEVRVIFPTRRNLERLALYSSFDAAVAHASKVPVAVISPWVETRDDVDFLCIPDGHGYPVTAEPLAAAKRG